MKLLPRRTTASMAAPLVLLLLLAPEAFAKDKPDPAPASQTANQPGNQNGNQNSQPTPNPAPADPKQPGNNPAESSNAAPSAAPSISLSAAPTESTNGGSAISITGAPTINSGGPTLSMFSLTATFPTIAGVGPVTQIVPNTAHAPFMQKSNMPQGTVFIAVAAILGALGASILAWRGAVAWSLHRSVQRAANNANYGETKSMLPKSSHGPPKSMYGAQALGTSNASLERLSGMPGRGPTGGRLTKSSHGMAPNAIGVNPSAARSSNLFFSPTAGAGNHSNPALGLATQNRSSAFLPAGYYSSPSAASPAAGAPTTHVGSTARASYVPRGNFAPSPPGSPGLPPARPSGEDLRRYGDSPSTFATAGVRSSNTTPLYANPSNSNLMLNVPGGAVNGQRAPSANLEDLFEHHGNGMNRY